MSLNGRIDFDRVGLSTINGHHSRFEKLNFYFRLAAGRAAYVPSAAVDAKTAETCPAGPGLHRSGDPAGDVEDSDSQLRRILARAARV